MPLGRAIRKVFVPDSGYVFVSADYSQIELRVLAHMAGDTHLIEAYQHGEDIHRMTASQVFGVPFEEVTPLLRMKCKGSKLWYCLRYQCVWFKSGFKDFEKRSERIY